jgi:hypothetical protein
MAQRMWKRGPDGEIVRSGPEWAEHRPPGAAPQAVLPRRASLGLALRLGFRDTYDYLGTVLLMSVVWGVAVSTSAVGGQALGYALFQRLPGLLPAFLSTLAALAGSVLMCGPLAGGFFRFARNAAAREEPDFFDLSWGFRRALGRSLSLAAVQTFGCVVLAGDAYFFLSLRNPFAAVVGALFGYAFVFWAMMSLYGWPLLAEQEIGTARILAKSALLALDNFGYTLLLGLAALLLTVVLWATVVAGALLWAGALAMIFTQGTRELLRKYGVLPPDPTLDPMAGETLD